MNDCIFTPHCTQLFCDRSCPILVETSYLLERNEISLSNPVFYKYSTLIDPVIHVLDQHQGQVTRVCDKSTPELSRAAKSCNLDTIQLADLLTYCAICRSWKGSQLHCTVYNLRYSRYMQELKASWTSGAESETLQFMRIWAETAKTLVISNFDYVKFGDYECQIILNLIQARRSKNLTTLIVGPETLIVASKPYAAALQVALGYFHDSGG